MSESPLHFIKATNTRPTGLRNFSNCRKIPEFDGLAGILPVNRAFQTELASARRLSDASNGSGRAILPRLLGTRTRAMLDNQVGLTPEQQAQNLFALQRAEFRPWELSPDLITAGLWIAYALFALMWFRMALRQNEGRWQAWARARILVPVVARAIRFSPGRALGRRLHSGVQQAVSGRRLSVLRRSNQRTLPRDVGQANNSPTGLPPSTILSGRPSGLIDSMRGLISSDLQTEQKRSGIVTGRSCTVVPSDDDEPITCPPLIPPPAMAALKTRG